ncbi:transglutaminase domain-containing protein, partial [Sansalvadorimonas verongulae]|uniref:transglutaminase domain-containing protein n=1 Tax=Sansalvadorimonas verongulae TaxID=2172824 RepID=UPI001E4E1585
LFFLLKERQGTCRHRTSAFIALSRYFNIPARYVASEIHSFPEYSLDNGKTWTARDLDGAPTEYSPHTPNFQPVVKGMVLTGRYQWMSQISPDMSPEKIAVLAKALGVSQEVLIGSLQSGTALPTSATSAPEIDDIVRKLWLQDSDSNAFILGSELLRS